MDKIFRIETLACTPNPQQIIYAALHQDYFSGYVGDSSLPSETECGAIAIKRLLGSERNHWGPLEHPQITLACGYFPHSTMQQLRTHRHITMDVQSFRYTGQQIVDVAEKIRDIEQVFYLRPVGAYTDRKGAKYFYSLAQRSYDLACCLEAAQHYRDRWMDGMPEEQARGLLPFDFRQHFVLSGNIRSLCHLMDMRSPANAQLECQWFCELLLEQLKRWVPEIGHWYEKNRYRKARLAP